MMPPVKLTLPTLLGLALLLGCSKNEPEPDPGRMTPPASMNLPPVPDPGMGINGSYVNRHLTDTGEQTKPFDADRYRVSALVPNSAGGFTVLTGTTHADGTFSVPVVPQGLYYLRTDYRSRSTDTWTVSDLVVTRERTVHLGSLFPGRPGLASVKMPTILTLHADNLSPWQTDDRVELFSLGADSWLRIEASDPMIAVVPGDTALTGVKVDLAERGFFHLLDASQGDTLHVNDWVSTRAGDLLVWSLARTFKAPPFTLVDGQPVEVRGSFETLPTRSIAVTWHQQAFAALASDVHPSARAQWHSFSVEAEPAGPGRATWGADVLRASTDLALAKAAPADQRLDLTFANPYPATWPLIAYASANFLVGAVEGAQWVEVSTWGPLETITGSPIRPLITPPRVLRFDGPTTAPKITWDPPAVGTAAAYLVEIIARDTDGSWDFPLWVFTQETSLTLPSDILRPGVPYYVTVAARTHYDPREPYRRFPAGGSAVASSGVRMP